jgi:hypothetical protein
MFDIDFDIKYLWLKTDQNKAQILTQLSQKSLLNELQVYSIFILYIGLNYTQ